VIEIAFLHAAPNARPLSDDDRERVEQRDADGPVFVYHAEDGLDESVALERTVMDAKSFPPKLLAGMIDSHAKVAAVRFRSNLANLANGAGEQSNVFFVSRPVPSINCT
jgi:hypothetical protein